LELEAACEAAIIAAIHNGTRTVNNRVCMTLLGGGAFGIHRSWITCPIERTLICFPERDLNVSLVNRGESKAPVREPVKHLT